MKKIVMTAINFFVDNNIIIAVFGLYVFITNCFGWQNCLSKIIFGIPCPGCGLSRATLALLRFDFVSAFNFNPCIFLILIIGIVIVYKEYPIISKIYKSLWFWIVILMIVFLAFILRMIYIYPNAPLDYYPDNLLMKIISLFHRLKNLLA